MTIKVGDTLPAAQFKLVHDGIQDAGTDDVFKDRTVVLFAVPGAFTPTCSAKHLPGYVGHYGAFKARGVDVACLAVNDAFVMEAWGRQQNVPAGLMLIADGNADFTRALGLELDATGYGMGLRAKRFALLARNGEVVSLHVEAPGEFKVSSAEAMLAALGD
jgi:peroxiredoxin